ncbi:MAG: MBL fold metallo-hydrolase, partial [Oxalobacteraceae bacterium]
MSDLHLEQAAAIIGKAQGGSGQSPVVKSFFDEPTFTVSYVVHDPATREAAIVDSVLNYDPAAGRTSFDSADAIIAYVKAQGLSVTWLLETHAHADHLSAAPYLK